MTARPIIATALLCLCASATRAEAQRPAPRDSMRREMSGMDGMGPMGRPRSMSIIRSMGPGGGAMGGMDGSIADMLLGQTSALKLSDQQVTRLAALARSAEAQRSAMMASMESMHRSMMTGDHGGAGGAEHMPADMEARMKSMHDQMHANIRDALAVLTPDQLATAWEHAHGGGGAMRMEVMERMMDGMPRDREHVIIRNP